MEKNKDILIKSLLEIKRLKELCKNNGLASEPTAIISMACRLPGGVKNAEDFWKLLSEGESGITEFPKGRWEHYGLERLSKYPFLEKGGFLQENMEEFDSLLFKILPNEAAFIDPQQRLALEVCWELFENAGYCIDSLKGKNIGVFVGATQNDFGHENMLSADDNTNITGMCLSFLAGRISYFFGLTGPSVTLDTACSSSLVAVDNAIKYLNAGDCDMALVCGTNIMFSPEVTIKLAALGILSENCELSAFDKNANGTVRGEGVVAILLKKLSRAEANHDPIQSLLLGTAVNSDGASSSITAPNGIAQKALLEAAWKKSNISSDEVDYIETHGTGTALGDPIEIKAITDALTDKRKRHLYIGSGKTNVGHLEGAAGLLGIMKTTLMLQHKKIVKSLNYNTASEYVNWNAIPVKVADQLMDWEESETGRTAGVSAFGLSGTNAHAILREYICQENISKDQEENKMSSYPFIFTSIDKKGLARQYDTFLSYLETNPDCNLTSLSYTQNITRAKLAERAVIMADGIEELKHTLQHAISGKADGNLYETRCSNNKKVVFMFTGQGSQYNFMCQDFYQTNASFQKAFDQCAVYYQKETGLDLHEIVFSEQYDLSQTFYTQPALFAVEYSLAVMWMDYGIVPDVVFGHSIGEYVAACIAEVISLEDAVKLVAERGRVFQEYAPEGRMMAVVGDKEVLQPIIADENEIYISLSNSDTQTVLAGTVDGIERAAYLLKEKKIKHTILKTRRPFHTPFMERAAEEFCTVAESVTYHKPKMKIVSNITSRFETDYMANADYWVQHIVSEVMFCDSVKNLDNMENKIFLEIGPAPVLYGLLGKITDGSAICEFSADKDTIAQNQIPKILSLLYLNGYDVDFKNYYKEFHPVICRIPNYAFERRITPYVHTIRNGQVSKDVSHLAKQEADGGRTANQQSRQKLEQTPEQVAESLMDLLVDYFGIRKEELDVDTNLLTLGVDSINAVKILNFIKNRFGTSIKLSDFFQTCTADGISRLICKHFDEKVEESELGNEIDAIAIDEAHRYEHFPLNEIQYAYWAGRDNKNRILSGVSCCAYMEVDVEDLDIPKFQHAVQKLVDRHDMLRCRITEDAEQYILREDKVNIPVYHYEECENREAKLAELQQRLARKIIPLEQPMYEVHVSQLSENVYRIHFLIDFMIADARSIYVFWEDLSRIYQGETLSELKITYKDYLTYSQNNEKILAQRKEDEKFWLGKVDNFPKAPELPYDKAKFVSGVDRVFVRHEKRIPAKQWNRFVEHVTKVGLTPSSALFTLYTEVLSAYGGGDSFAVMLTVFQRHPMNQDVDRIIGDFTKLALVEVNRKNRSIIENGQQLQKTIMENISHAEYSAVDFTDKLRKYNQDERMYNVIFTSALGVANGMIKEKNNDSFDFTSHLKSIVSSTPQVCLDHQVLFEQNEVVLSWDSLDAVFMNHVVDAMFEVYCQLVEKAMEDADFFQTILTDLRPQAQIDAHTLVNQTEAAYQPRTLLELFEQHVEKAPEHVAVIAGGKSYSYQELALQSARVANTLLMNGFKKGDRILIDLPKSWEQMYSVLGVIKAGGVYVPLTHNQPMSRTMSIIEKSKASGIIRYEKDESFGIPCYTIKDLQKAEFTREDFEERKPTISPSDGAYIIYTSGSTGTPKGVYITHRAAMNTIEDVNCKYCITEQDRALAVSSLSFDLSVYDIFGMLSAGGAIVLPTEEERIDPRNQCELAIQNGVTVWNSVPAIMGLLTDYLLKKSIQIHSIRRIILSGDWIPMELPEKIKKSLPNAHLTSMGGATEASIWSNYYDVDGSLDDSWNSIPYGYPLANQQFYILDEFGRMCPDYVSGKLHIAGLGLAECYYNEPELTRNAFYQVDAVKSRLYLTGDYGRYHTGGIIEFLGRLDGQVKINGYRIESAEILSAIAKCGVKERTVMVSVGDRSKKIVVFIESSETINQEQLKKQMKDYLPNYFIPEAIITVEKMPVTANSKIDAKKLTAIYHEFSKNIVHDTNVKTSSNHPVLNKVKEILEIDEITEQDSFSALGVSSVDMIRLADELEGIYQVRPSISKMIAYQSVSELVDFFKGIEVVERALPVTKRKHADFDKRSKEDTENPIGKNLVATFEEKGIHLYTEDGKVKFQAPKGVMTKDLLEELKQNKENILIYLKDKQEKQQHQQEYIEKHAFALTPIQKAYLYGRADAYELGGTSAHYYTELEWDGLDIEKLEEAVNIVVEQNDMLQAIVLENGTQVILEDLPVYHIKTLHVTEKELLEKRAEWSSYQYQMEHWPMFDIFVTIKENSVKTVHFSFDCILLDGWSANMMISEIFNAYKDKEVPKPSFTFRDYIERKDQWLEGKEYYKEAQKFWEQNINTLPKAPQLPYKCSFEEVTVPHFRRKRFELSKEKTLKLNEKVKAYSMTASAIICTAYMRTLAKYSATKEFSLNLTLFNRLPMHPDVWKLLGDFTNITLVPYRGNGSGNFLEDANQVKDFIVKAVEHRTFNGLELLKSFGSDNIFEAVMPVVFTSELFGSLDSQEKTEVFTETKEVYSISQTPQVALDHQALLRNNQLILIWDYVSDLFEEEVMDQMFDDFITLVDNLAEGKGWD